MDNEKQRRLNINLEKLFINIKDYEIELAKNYIKSFENQGYNVIYFYYKLQLIKTERQIIKGSESKIIDKFNKDFILN